MAPISDKRSQPHKSSPSPTRIPRDNTGYASHSHATRAKENANNLKHSKRGLEILDFHESWLEEMELYKDQLCGQKHHQQHMLSSHNHLHTSQGCQVQTINANLLQAITAAVIANNNTSEKVQTRLKGSSEHTTGSSANSGAKPRITIRSGNIGGSPAASAANTLASVAAELRPNDASPPTGVIMPQLYLKRPRDESSSAKSPSPTNSSKRHARPSSQPTHSQAQSHTHQPQMQTHHSAAAGTALPHVPHVTIAGPQNTAKNGSGLPVLPTANSNSSGICSTGNGSNKPIAKVIVNQFHASSLLNAHHHEEKTKILAQNGLTKSAASAYETSFYASNYLAHGNIFNSAMRTHPAYENFNYVGVSLAKNLGLSGGGDSTRATGGGGANDDPCAAIDDVNDYTDSDSEDEYTGFAFFLPNDAENDDHQSQNIRCQEESSTPRGSEDSDTETSTERSNEYFTPKSILSPSMFPNVPPYLNFSSHAGKGPSMPAALHRVLKWKLSPVMPKIVKRVVLNSGFRIIKNTTDWMAIWEKHMKSPGFRTIRSHQKYNHMPGSFRIGRKDTMWRSIHNNMKKFGNKEFGFMQKSYIMPEDLESLRQVWPKSASRLTKWIVKPPASARGTGIRIVNKWSQFPKDRALVVQKYIERPLLINDSKFDMRIYVVVTSINPLRIYMYKDGLARFASVKYSSELNSLDDRCMHLTNYSINKFSQNYSKNEDFNACQGHKWTLQSLWCCLEARGVNTKRLWATLRNLVIKAIISGESGLNRMYRQNVNFRYNCFELFGFDVLLDENLVPWLLEINISPSLHSELPLDLHVKGPLIQAVLNTALYQVPPKLSDSQQRHILDELNLKGPLCLDKRLFTTCLTTEEVRKHNQYTNRSIEYREEYLESILENLLPDDVRCLIITEDEFGRSKPLERIFPTPETHSYLKFIDNPRYYNRLLDAWEHRYGHCREEGIITLQRLCKQEYHLQVSDAAMEKEPNVTVTEIDMLHVKKEEDPLTGTVLNLASIASDSTNASKAGSPDSHTDGSPTGVLLAVGCSKEAHENNGKSGKEHQRPIVMKVN